MPTDIVMPQMGESIFKVRSPNGSRSLATRCNEDEPLFEISTDKVDAEIPAPAAGILQDIKVAEGSTVQVNTVVGTISADGESAPQKSQSETTPSPAAAAKKDSAPAKSSAAPNEARQSPPVSSGPVSQEREHEEEDHARSSPLVRKIARENNINLADVSGTGLGGRITKQDITAFLERVNRPRPHQCLLHPPRR